jgi:hypothetical protein
MKIGLKFCGGCNPGYDRLRTADCLRRRFGEKVDWVSHDDRDVDRAVILAGCPTACVDLDIRKGLPFHLIVSENDLERVIGEIAARLQ